MPAGGYVGKILWVNLEQGSSRVEELSSEDAYEYIGGYGLGAKYLYERLDKDTDPLGPENILGLITGPLTGTEALIGSRFMAVAKSPLTGMWCDSNAGGRFGYHLKRAGFDAVFIEGIAKERVMLLVEDGKVTISDASFLWGKDTVETENMLKAEYGEDTDAAFIGPAGERSALTSGIVTYDARICARGGLGAVMGSKNLKAVVVKGSGKIEVADPERVSKLRKACLPAAREGLGGLLNRYGTCGLLISANETGDAPVKNWAGSGAVDFKTAANISDENVIKYQTKRYGCYKCPVACGGTLTVKSGKYQTENSAKIEYETLGAFGTMCLNDDVESLIKINDICNRYGIDTISTGAAVAFCMEAYEKNVLSSADLNGLDLTWGAADAAVKLTEMIACGEGVGKLLGDGLAKTTAELKQGTEDWAMHIRGEALPMHDPRWGKGLATAYLADATPARHTQGSTTFAPSGLKLPDFKEFDQIEYGIAHKNSANFYHAASSAGLCLFGFFIFTAEDILSFFNAATGLSFTMEDFLRAGERIATCRQAFNAREGLQFVDDKAVPRRAFGDPPLNDGPLAGITVNYKQMVKNYYKVSGWDEETGMPLPDKLKELNLEQLVKKL